ncbi:hypothetical protein M422DRAFT_25376 [Sphaerobolus stellatus SS14]|nr:hypothetical protein M422DRAFT_25376 [Sphaerobolus stellatus SS14]
MDSTSNYMKDPGDFPQNYDGFGGPVTQNVLVHQETQWDSVFPINSLPVGTIGEIFSWVVYGDTPLDKIIPSGPGHEERGMIHILLQTCHKWRAIAMGKPQLFTGIILLEVPRVNPLVVVHRWIALSGRLPLDIYCH